MDFIGKLRRLEKECEFSQSDFACWFNRSRLTVRSWLIDGRQPRGFSGQRAAAALDLLEAVHQRGWLEKELEGVSSHERPGKIQALRERAESSRVLRSDLTSGGVASRLHSSR